MKPIVFESKVGGDGVLHLDVPVGPGSADRVVRVTVEPVAGPTPMSQDEWRAFIQATAGSIDDPTFERPPQGEFERREPLP